MEYLGVPLYILVRDLAPALVVTVAGLWVVVVRPIQRRGVAVTALSLYLTAAALPYLWLMTQTLLSYGGETWIAFIMTFLQPGVAACGWFLLFLLVVLASPRHQVRQSAAEGRTRPPESVVDTTHS